MVALYTILLMEGAVKPDSNFVIVRDAGDDIFGDAATQACAATPIKTTALAVVHDASPPASVMKRRSQPALSKMPSCALC